MFIYSLKALSAIPEITHVALNYPSGWRDVFIELLTDYGLSDRVRLIPAGKTRQDSVKKLLEATASDNNDSVILHEAARPLVSRAEFLELIDATSKNVSFGIEIPFTVLQLDSERKYIDENLARDLLVNVQLPQKYERSALLAKHILAEKEGCYFTEDASLMHYYGEKVEFIPGRSHNIKVTNHADIEVVEAMMEKRNLFK